MMLVDSNILMYAAGAAHPNKRPSLDLLKRVARTEVDAVIDAEVLQEILHRYRAIGRWREGKGVFDEARRLFPTVVSVDACALDRARELMEDLPVLMARDALHAAVVLEHEFEGIYSFDSDFDRIEGLKRIEPGHPRSA